TPDHGVLHSPSRRTTANPYAGNDLAGHACLPSPTAGRALPCASSLTATGPDRSSPTRGVLLLTSSAALRRPRRCAWPSGRQRNGHRLLGGLCSGVPRPAIASQAHRVPHARRLRVQLQSLTRAELRSSPPPLFQSSRSVALEIWDPPSRFPLQD